MSTLHYDLSQNGKKFKVLNATNGGPIHKRHANDQYRDNLQAYKIEHEIKNIIFIRRKILPNGQGFASISYGTTTKAGRTGII